jgi:hypothetical protein
MQELKADFPELWNMGKAQYSPSPASKASSGTHDHIWKIRAQGDSTALDGPVVPEVNKIAPGSR